MASALKNFRISPYCAINSEYKRQRSIQIRCLSSRDSTVNSIDGVSTITEKEKIIPSIDLGNGISSSIVTEKKKEDDNGVQETLEPLWNDGYGSLSVKDYFEFAKEIIKPDGGPPRWFTPLSCGPPLRDSPVLLFLPGMDGLGLGLILHHEALGKVFEVWCMHIPVYDQTPFEELVKFVERSIRIKHASSPDKPIYVVGDSFGGCLALAVAARNPTIDLVVVLANPATSFGRSQLQPLLPLLEAMPDQLHVTVPYLLSLVMGDPAKMATVDIDIATPPRLFFEKLSSNLTSLLPRLSELSEIIPRETLLWKLKLLNSAAAYANSRLHAVRAEVLIIASGKDNLLPSKDEAARLSSFLKTCKIRIFKDNGHTILLEDGVNLLTIIKAASTYRRSRRRDYVRDYLPPSASEFKQSVEGNKWFRNFTGPVMFSTMGDGTVVKGLAGIPDEGPVLIVGYHMLMGLELFPLGEQYLQEKKKVLHGIAHPVFFTEPNQGEPREFSIVDTLRQYGAMPVSASNLFKLFSAKSHILLYPGGAREALHNKGEAYKLFWPDEPEFVRMAAKFGATIVPFGVVGEDDVAEFIVDYNDLMKIPFLNDYIRDLNKQSAQVRNSIPGERGNHPLYFPGLLPKVPGRFYYKFGKPIQLKGKEEISKDKEQAKKIYLEIKSEVEDILAYLVKKREEDPYRSVVDRTVYRTFSAPMDQLPTFEP